MRINEKKRRKKIKTRVEATVIFSSWSRVTRISVRSCGKPTDSSALTFGKILAAKWQLSVIKAKLSVEVKGTKQVLSPRPKDLSLWLLLRMWVGGDDFRSTRKRFKKETMFVLNITPRLLLYASFESAVRIIPRRFIKTKLYYMHCSQRYGIPWREIEWKSAYKGTRADAVKKVINQPTYKEQLKIKIENHE